MLRIGVLADTHVQNQGAASRVLQLLAAPFASVDVILHAGDVGDPDFLHSLNRPVYAVRGNVDHDDPRLPPQRIVELDGWRFGLIHGWGDRNGVLRRVQQAFEQPHPDCVIFGHSHIPYNQRHGTTLFFNPGSPSERRSAPHHTVGIIVADQNTLAGEIIRLD